MADMVNQMISPGGRGAAAKTPRNNGRGAEILAFVLLAILISPVLAVGVVGGYGFIVWMSQLILGPPGPPH